MKKFLKVIGVIVALAGAVVAVYMAVQKYKESKAPQYFDDNDFFECDNEIEIVEAKEEPEEVQESKKEAPKKAKKSAKKAQADAE